MSKKSLISAITIILLLLLIIAGVGYWLPPLINHLLPAGVRLDFVTRPYWQHWQLNARQIRLTAEQCPLATADNFTLAYQSATIVARLEQLKLQQSCFSHWPLGNNSNTPISLSQIQSYLPSINLNVSKISGSIAENFQGRLEVKLKKYQQMLQYTSRDLQLAANLSGTQLNIVRLSLASPLLAQPLKLQGHIRFNDTLNSLPLQANISGQFQSRQLAEPLHLEFNWQDNQGLFMINRIAAAQPLLKLPFRITADTFDIQQGQWQWPDPRQSLQGGMQMTITNLHKGWQQSTVSGRLNILTGGKGGKGNSVVSFGPGQLSLRHITMPLRLTGEAKLADIQLYAGLPAQLQGSLSSPDLHFLPGALLRARGTLLPDWQVDEARWPLSGVSVDLSGINGPLQARLTIHNNQQGFYQLNLAGKAQHFLPDKGRWQWKYWGKGQLRPLQANWTITGHGFWHDKLITLASMQTGFDKIRYNGLRINRPTLRLIDPISWLTDKSAPRFSGQLRLNSDKSHFGRDSELAPAQADITINGRSPQQFSWKAKLTAGPVGPVIIKGRRDADHWLGRAWWPLQSLTVFQSLLSPQRQQIIRSGSLKAQLAFSVTGKQGFTGGGHFVVSNGVIWTPASLISGINFSLPFNYQHDVWLFGKKAPVQLRIASISNKITLNHITADLQGYYPYDDHQPLFLNNTGIHLFGGTAHLAQLRLPQHQPAMLKFDHIDLSKLIQLLNPDSVTLSGHIAAQLPLWLTGQGGFYTDTGWLKNQGPLTMRIDKAALQQLTQHNLLAGMGIDWLNYMQISTLSANVQVNPQGEMALIATVDGNSQGDKKRQRIRLNYRQQQNIVQLWRSLNFATNLRSWLQQYGSHP